MTRVVTPLARELDSYWIGVDLGGTWVKAWVIQATPQGLKLVSDVERVRWNETGFQAVPLADQRAGIAPSAEEQAAHDALIRATAHAIHAQCDWLGARGHAGAVPVALCSAGPKTPDGRGVAYWLNGPRIPDWIGALKSEIDAPLIWPARIWDDQDAGAMGEVFGAGGALFGFASKTPGYHALVLSIGTGVAEAWLDQGALRAWPMPRAHELTPNDLGDFAEPCAKALARTDAPREAHSLDALASLRLIPDGHASLDSAWDCAQALIGHRVACFRETLGVEFDRIVIGGKGAEVWAGRSLAALDIPLHFSKLYGAAALGAVALSQQAQQAH